MFLSVTISLLLLAAGVGVLAFRALAGARAELVQANDAADQYAAQLHQALQELADKSVTPLHHTRPTLNMIEDTAAVFDDLDRTLRQLLEYSLARLNNGRQIIRDGRRGPLSYKSIGTANRPPRPSHNVKLWELVK